MNWRVLFKLCGICLLALILVVAVVIKSRGMLLERKVNNLLLLVDDGTIMAGYSEYQFFPTQSRSGGYDGGELVILGGSRSRSIGFVVYDSPPVVVGWLISLFGEHCFVNVTDIYVPDLRFGDGHVDLLLAFSNVREVDVSNSSITDEGVQKLSTLRRLVRLDISGTRISPASLRSLSNCKELQELHLFNTAVDAEGVKRLKNELPNCDVFW